MLVDSEPKEECYHSLNWVTAGKANQKKMEGGVKWASSLHVRVGGHWSTTLMQNAPTHREVPTLIVEGQHYTLQSSCTKKITEHKVMLLKKKEGTDRLLTNTPLLTIISNSLYTYFALILTVVHTRRLL